MSDNNKNIKEILDDLYKIDPALEEYEEKVKEAIKELLKSKPDTKIDQKFVAELREKLIDRAEQLKYHPQKSRKPFWRTALLPKLAYGFGGILALVLCVGLYFHFTNTNVTQIGQNAGHNELKTVALGNNAFGSLQIDNSNLGTQEGATNDTSAPTATRATTKSTTGLGGGGGMSASGATPSVMPICDTPDCPYYYSFKYVYTGDTITLDQNQVEVLRRTGRTDYNGSISGLLKSFGFGLADISGFDGARLQSVNLVQDKDFGYSIYINFDEGTISIDAYWPKWPHQQVTDCKGDVCATTYENWPNLSSSDVPPDADLINIANSFAASHGIDLSYYGQPEVIKDWISPVPLPAGKEATITQPYVSDTISLKYPLMINGKYVYDQSGSKFGLTFVVNIRFNRISGVYNLNLQNYESSMYEAETDFSKILAIAEKGGIYNYLYSSGGQTKEVEIGTPEQAYVVTWQIEENSPTARMLMIPALVFPITKTVEGYYPYISKIVIPLAKEMLEQSNNYPGPIRPMMEKSTNQ